VGDRDITATVDSPSESRVRSRQVFERLSSTRSVNPPGAGASTLATYKVGLGKGGALSVTLPASVGPGQVAVIVDQLRELADALAYAAQLPDCEPMAREELLRLSDDLAEAAESPLDGAQKEHLLQAYDLFRQAVVAYLNGSA